ncbi:hypothetical protein [Chenggangzhangella methanolivorans]|uniref:Glycine zipper domain-containing protein n=1 Tax=Chenggangzhangella methanolivorans TaxID=1437009 RepID=A0A9E6RJ04_9HYPH|nr:hypothetical protein [Chenggangzhangella methanolivorans]QZO01882.1 hypothetical protein K6K41_11380 [Chenggangzhangella methanolivorans]
MKRSLALGLAAATALAGALATQPAEARIGRGGALVGGLLAGAVVGSAIADANRRPRVKYYYGGPAYYAAPAYPSYCGAPPYPPCPVPY